mgnify:CR=1 FL=1
MIMVCCALIAGILGLFTLLVSPFVKQHAPLAWRGEVALPKAAPFSWRARLASFQFAFSGIGFVMTKEHNMRIHAVAAILVILVGIFLKLTATDWRWIAVAIMSVIVAETLNTAIEKTCNAMGNHYNEHVRVAKDVAAGAVLLSCGFAIFIGFSVMLPYAMVVEIPKNFNDFADLNMCTSSK